MPLLKKHTGESILEVIIAFTILGVVLSSMFIFFQQLLGVNLNIRHRSIALYLAQEGLESVRHIRDTNWLRFSGDRRTHWMCLQAGKEEATGDTICEVPMPSTKTYYRSLYDETDYEYQLEKAPYLDPLPMDIDSFEQPSFTSQFTFFTLEQGTDGRYRHTDTTPTSEHKIFFREIALELQNPYQDTPPDFCDNEPTCTEASLKAVARVGWIEKQSLRVVELETQLFDYFKRTSY